MSKYTVLIDESGEAGIEKVRTDINPHGASPYMTLGAAIIKNENFEATLDKLKLIKTTINKKSLHCSQLNHFQKVYFAKNASKLPIYCFGLISKKDTLGSYAIDIENDSNQYFNKCVQYLLKCICDFMKEHEISSHQVDFIFEHANFDYDQLCNLIRKCQDTPKGRTTFQENRIKLLRELNTERIDTRTKIEEPLLQIADLIAHSLYKCVDRPISCYKLNETRYLEEFKNKFYFDKKTKKVIGKGIKPVHRLAHLNLDNKTKFFLENLEHS